MQVFKLFFKIVKTKWLPILVYLAIFFTILTFSDVSGDTGSFKRSKLRLTVYDEDNSEASKKLMEFIEKNNELVEVEDDTDKLIDSLYVTSTQYVITINKGFEEKLAGDESEDLFKARYIHDSYSNRLADNMLDSYVSTTRAYAASGMSLSEAQTAAAEALSAETEVTFKNFSDNTSEKAASFFHYMPYALWSIIVSVLCPVIMVMKKKDISFRTKCSGIKEGEVGRQTVLASLIMVAGIWLALMVLGIVKNGGMLSGNMWFAALNSIVFSLVCLAIAVLISTIGVSENVLTFLTQVFGLGMAFLCGMFVPMELLSNGVLAIGRFLPAYWYVRANNMICNMGAEAFDSGKVLMCMGIEILFALAIFAVDGVLRRQKRT